MRGLNSVLPDSSDDNDAASDNASTGSQGGTGGTAASGSKKRVRFWKAVTNEGEEWLVGPSMYQRAHESVRIHLVR